YMLESVALHRTEFRHPDAFRAKERRCTQCGGTARLMAGICSVVCHADGEFSDWALRRSIGALRRLAGAMDLAHTHGAGWILCRCLRVGILVDEGTGEPPRVAAFVAVDGDTVPMVPTARSRGTGHWPRCTANAIQQRDFGSTALDAIPLDHELLPGAGGKSGGGGGGGAPPSSYDGVRGGSPACSSCSLQPPHR